MRTGRTSVLRRGCGYAAALLTAAGSVTGVPVVGLVGGSLLAMHTAVRAQAQDLDPAQLVRDAQAAEDRAAQYGPLIQNAEKALKKEEPGTEAHKSAEDIVNGLKDAQQRAKDFADLLKRLAAARIKSDTTAKTGAPTPGAEAAADKSREPEPKPAETAPNPMERKSAETELKSSQTELKLADAERKLAEIERRLAETERRAATAVRSESGTLGGDSGRIIILREPAPDYDVRSTPGAGRIFSTNVGPLRLEVGVGSQRDAYSYDPPVGSGPTQPGKESLGRKLRKSVGIFLK